MLPLRRAINSMIAAGGSDHHQSVRKVAPQDVLEAVGKPNIAIVCALEDDQFLIEGSMSRQQFEGSDADKYSVVIVYCSSWSCPLGETYAKALARQRPGVIVLDYAGGLGEWALLQSSGRAGYTFANEKSAGEVLEHHLHQYYRKKHSLAQLRVPLPPIVFRCIAVVDMNGVTGTARFESTSDSACTITYRFEGLSKGLHGFHVHRCGDMSRGCESACDHFNPLNSNHGGVHSKVRHAGDLGNVESDDDAVAEGTIRDVRDISCDPTSKFSIVGRMIVLHEDEDDLGLKKDDPESLKTGNAGRRVACGVIGIA